jgi:hypothetical protein
MKYSYRQESRCTWVRCVFVSYKYAVGPLEKKSNTTGQDKVGPHITHRQIRTLVAFPRAHDTKLHAARP